MLLTFGVMALVRITSTEGLTNDAPGEFGLVLGLDRAPDMKTARRKVAELAARGRALDFSRAFSERWATEAPEALGYLYLDGHVRPYHGRTVPLPKTHVPTVKMVAYRAETQLTNLVGPLLPYRDDEARKFMRQVFELPADLLPDYERGDSWFACTA